jgi:uncharacterized membrane protein
MKGGLFYIVVYLFIAITTVTMICFVNTVSHKARTITGSKGLKIKGESARAVIKETKNYQTKEESERGFIRQEIFAKIISGSFKGEQVTIKNAFRPKAFPDETNRIYKKNDRVNLFVQYSDSKISHVFIENTIRDDILLVLLSIFVILLILVGKSMGIKTTIALILDLVIIIFFFVPLVSRAFSPFLVTIASIAFILSSTFFIIAGFSKKSISAIAGAIGGILVAAILIYIFADLMHFSGVRTYWSYYMFSLEGGKAIDFQGLFLASMLIGMTGIAMDGAMDVSSFINELYIYNPKMNIFDAFASGINVGVDVIGTMCNTLIFAYLGKNIPLLLLFQSTILNTEVVASEIIRMCFGSVGFFITIPLTSFFASVVYYKK